MARSMEKKAVDPLQYRIEEARKMGLDHTDAEKFAMSPVALAELRSLIARGATPLQALRILL